MISSQNQSLFTYSSESCCARSHQIVHVYLMMWLICLQACLQKLKLLCFSAHKKSMARDRRWLQSDGRRAYWSWPVPPLKESLLHVLSCWSLLCVVDCVCACAPSLWQVSTGTKYWMRLLKHVPLIKCPHQSIGHRNSFRALLSALYDFMNVFAHAVLPIRATEEPRHNCIALCCCEVATQPSWADGPLSSSESVRALCCGMITNRFIPTYTVKGLVAARVDISCPAEVGLLLPPPTPPQLTVSCLMWDSE